ncbi:hypothetical protein BGZ72_007288 [Mortierella alpina]|nr:hypothetical protein BGZ72_007288 [Mortierella alpina]
MSTAGPKPGPSKRSSRGKGPNRGQAKTKIVVRRLPANLPEHVFLDTIKTLVPEPSIDRPTTWVAGKVSKNPVKGNTFARAYIYFKSEKLAADFKRAYHGHLFVDRNGNEGRAHVEFAPFQKIPREQRKPDAKQGTIEEDPDYIAFLQSLNAEPTEAEKEMKLSATEQLLKESFHNPKQTPLLEDLRTKKIAAAHAKSQASKLSARQARQAGKAGISNAGKAQITILANRNAKDAPNGRAPQGSSGSGNKNQQAAQQQGAQGKKVPPSSGPDGAQGAKPKRERKRRDRASKRAANEAATAGSSNTSETTTPQITLLKPKPAAESSSPAGQGHSANGSSAAQGAQGPPHSGARRGQHNQPQPQQQQLQQTGAFNQGAAKKDNVQQLPGAEGATARPGRTRRGGRGERSKAESKAASGNAPPNSHGSNNNAGGSSGPNTPASGNNPPGGQGPGPSRPGRSRRGRGGAGHDGPATHAVKE